MSDGTALNLGDPNSMRDQGQVRNAVYNGRIKFNESKSMQRLPYDQFLRRDGPQNQSFYSFGGKKFIRDETERDHLLNPLFRDYDGKVGTARSEMVVYPKFLNQRVNDYTKNISQSIFSPGELPSKKYGPKQKDVWQGHPQKDRSGMKIKPTTKTAYPTSRKKLDTIASKINEESRKKKELAAQIEEVRSVMSQCAASIAGSHR